MGKGHQTDKGLLPFKGYQSEQFCNQTLTPNDSQADTNAANGCAPHQTTNLVEEVPISLSINNISCAVMMATPLNPKEFIVGFARSEGIIECKNDIRDIEVARQPLNLLQDQRRHDQNSNDDITNSNLSIDGMSINLTISPRRLTQFKQRKQQFLGASGCGLCGVESLDQALPQLKKLPESTSPPLNKLNKFKDVLSKHQVIGQHSGAIHAALLLSPDLSIITCMEDIGRHNALDKVIGYAVLNEIDLHDHLALMSSRCSTELVQKAVRVQLSNLVNLASPSLLAVQLAKHYGLRLIHLPKHATPRVFTCSKARQATNDKKNKT